MRGISSIVASRGLLSGLLAAVVLPVAVFGSVLVAVPGAGAGPTAWSATKPPPPTPTPPAPPPPTSPPTPTPSPTGSDRPTTPTNLAVVAVRSNSVTLSWTASTPGCCPLLGYDVGVWRAFNDVISLSHVGDVTTVVFTSGIRPASQYTIQVYARDVDGRTSSASNSVLVMTPATDTGPDTTPPQTPADLAARDVTGSSAELTWSAATDDVGVTGYQVYRFDGWYTSTLLATVTGTSHRVDLVLSRRNIFYVRAVDAAGNLSIATPTITLEATATPTPAPPTCQVSYAVQAQWRGGFIAEVTIHNLESAPVDGWTLTFAYSDGQRVRTAWNTRHAQSGATVTARDLRWNRTIPAGGSVSFGILGTWRGGNAPPAGFTLNDKPCATG
ncbi:cellulose binding domain-containing protein [Solwaraspora sp. WMMD1047]|uniref:cellulose binding domain-containing protein n=1 Tax=Solwaraspora sp. WMMD1047 TaxID=3016102 RepID=UPI0024161641|nr:cellulose binding domain-containing protein [Solwaraspora sp. WMMD1047]MDG4829807.1 cellulose binding domain-containing protein [Solwaraspora sp. WMMD1047]